MEFTQKWHKGEGRTYGSKGTMEMDTVGGNMTEALKVEFEIESRVMIARLKKNH